MGKGVEGEGKKMGYQGSAAFKKGCGTQKKVQGIFSRERVIA